MQRFFLKDKISDTSKNLHIVLGIDHTLCTLEKVNNQDEVEKCLNELEKNGSREKVIQVPMRLMKNGKSEIALYILHRGAIEFIQWLYTKIGARISFFNDEIKELNQSFVSKFLSLALGEDGYRLIIKSVSVYSCEDMKKHIKVLENIKHEKFGLNMGRFKKDLTVTVPNYGENLDKTVLISDGDSYISHGQEKNSLIVPCTYSGAENAIINEGCNFHDLLRLNNIFYMVGILKNALDMMAANGGNFVDHLFSLQFKLNDDKATYRPISPLSVDRFKYYQDGLSELQSIHPQLEFHGSMHLYDLSIGSGLMSNVVLRSQIMDEMESIVQFETQLPHSLILLLLSYLTYAWEYKDGLDAYSPKVPLSSLRFFSPPKNDQKKKLEEAIFPAKNAIK